MFSCPRWIICTTVLLIAIPAFAGLHDIHPEQLPQTPEVQKAYTDLVRLEPMVETWTPTWRYETPKAEVVALLKVSQDRLQEALGATPDNEELLLVTGLAAHYAYNMDIGKTDLVAQSLERAQKLAPGDYRPSWFLAIHQCQANPIKEGMEKLLSIENGHSWDHLPSDFWFDYLVCANLANMPAHGLRAGEYLVKLKAPSAGSLGPFMNALRKRFIATDIAGTYSWKDVWSYAEFHSQKLMKNYLCGFMFAQPERSRFGFSDVKQGQCELHMQLPSQAGSGGEVLSNIYFLARPPKPGETLNDFIRAYWEQGYGVAKPINTVCPAQDCIAVHGTNLEQHPLEGGGRVVMTAFKRDAPAFPGLLLETPANPPGGEPGQTILRPPERLHRLEGPLYYLVAVYTASSVFQKAEADYHAILSSFKVE